MDQYRSYNRRDNDKRELRKRQTDNDHPTNKRYKPKDSDEHVTLDKKNERRDKGVCIKCGEQGHFMMECSTGWRSKTPTPEKYTPNSEANSEKSDTGKKQKKAESGNLRITELGSETEKSDSENE